jgi:hypothetical protein
MNNELGEIIKFKYPTEYANNTITVRQDHPSQDPYIDEWGAAGQPPQQAQLDVWDGELDAYKAQKAVENDNRVAAENRLRNPMPTTSIPALREMVDDILTYLKLDV